MNCKHFIAGLGILSLSLFILPARAAVISYSTDFSIASSAPLRDYNPDNSIYERQRDDVRVSLDRFDGSLGILTDVDIWFESDWSLGSSVQSFDRVSNTATASAQGRSISRQSARLIDPFRDVQVNREVIRSSCNDRATCFGLNLDSGMFNDFFDLSLFSLDEFIGSNLLDFRLVRTLTSDLTACGVNDACRHTNYNNAWGGTVFVNYTFSVPEPSILALIGLGLVGMGAGRLRRHAA